MRIEYKLNYNKYSSLNGNSGYILKGKTFEKKEELKKYIKNNLKKEDVIISIYKIEITKLNLINLEEMK